LFTFVGAFDVYNVENAMPKIEWDTVEANLRAANDEEKRVWSKPIKLIDFTSN
jgi:hypothetical protein